MEYLNIKKTRDYFTTKFQNKRYRFYYYLTLSLITILVFIVFAIYPTINQIFQELNTITIINGQNTQMQSRYSEINSTYSQYKTLVVPNKEIFSNSLPNNKNTGYIFANLYQIMKNNNLSLNTISFNSSSHLSSIEPLFPIVANSSLGIFNISISSSGTYNSYLSFLSTLSKYPQKILVYNLSFSPNSQNSSVNGVSVSNLLKTQGSVSFEALVFYY
jgi:hypothetical protein